MKSIEACLKQIENTTLNEALREDLSEQRDEKVVAIRQGNTTEQ